MKNIYRSIVEEYEKINAAETDRLNALEEKLNGNADYSASRRQIAVIDLKLAKADVDGDKKTYALLKKQRAEQVEKARAAVVACGVEPESLKRRYVCPICKDSGNVGGKPCKCYIEKLSKYTREFFDISNPFLPSKKDDIAEKPPLLNKYYKLMEKFVDTFPSTKTNNFVFLGKTGTGKSFLASRVAADLKDKGFNVVFITAFALNNLFCRYHGELFSERIAFLDALVKCDLLVIDDLGSEPIFKNITVEYLLSVISERLSRGAHTIITTNLTQDEILTRYNERFFSRIFEKKQSAILLFNENNLRM